VPLRKTPSLSQADRTRLWRKSAKGMPHTPPLSDETVSREGFYDARGWMSVLVDSNVLLRRVWAKAKRLRANRRHRFPPAQ